jgi:hypothetical protein
MRIKLVPEVKIPRAKDSGAAMLSGGNAERLSGTSAEVTR